MTAIATPNVLLADASAEHLERLKGFLQGIDGNLITTTSSQELLRIVLEKEFGLVILATQLPPVNGIEVTELIRDIQQTKHFALILLIHHEEELETFLPEDSEDVIDFLIKQGVKPVAPQVAAQLSLLDAAENHDIIRMEKSLREGAKLNCVFKGNKVSALMIAVSNHVSSFESESYGAIAYLLQKGANPNFKGLYGKTPLHLAMLVTKRFSGIKDSATAQKTYRRLSLQALIKAGANVSLRNDKDETPLHIAALWDNMFGAKFLLENGANINLKDQDGKTPLDYAESAEMIKLLKSHGAKEK